jgi:UDP-N-acetylmuramate dehydrogenase
MLTYNEPMSRHTSWQVGGPAERFYRPADVADLAEFLAGLPAGEPVMVVGLGSNLLVRDGGFDGTVVFTHGSLDAIRLEADGSLYVEAGVASPKVARYAANHGLVGAEFLAGIPGTFGGALAMNAGLTLHVRLLYGDNDHHMLEAAFKALGRALDQATSLDSRARGVASTKGVL